MNIIKRLLNAFVLIGAVLILIGFGFGVNEYLQSLKERVGACEREAELDVVVKNPPFKIVTEKDGRVYFVYTINGKRIKAEGRLTQVEIDEIRSELANEARSRCNSESQIYEIFSDEIGILFGGGFLLLLLNYILFGKFTLWNRVADTQKSDDGKS